MKINCLQISTGVAFLTVALAGFDAKADTVVYDNTAATSYLNQFFSANNEFGDEINLAGSARTVTDFKFEYFANLTTLGDDTVHFRIYANGSGTGAAPQTLLYDSNTDAPGGIPLFNGLQTVDISGLSLSVPSKLTWTAQFTTSTGDTAGLPLYSPATIGGVLLGGEIGSRDDFWQNINGTWTLTRYPNGTPAGNFAAQVTAVPEPSSIALGVLGGLALLGSQAVRRRNAK
ncbi:MAG: hypothetical protein HY043_06360 [Verrucomicrobia bacterium]|nr:hypothetical protein [Verrucomicrobiota bacterium]